MHPPVATNEIVKIMHKFGFVPKSCMGGVFVITIFTIFACCINKTCFVNQKNTIKSMIPERLLKLVPTAVRDKWANRIVDKVKAHNPALYAAIGQWSFIPDEEKETVINEILEAAQQVHWEIQDESISS